MAPIQGKISARDIWDIAKELGEHFSNEEIMEMIEEADRNGEQSVILCLWFLYNRVENLTCFSTSSDGGMLIAFIV